VRACVRACTRRLTCPLLPDVNSKYLRSNARPLCPRAGVRLSGPAYVTAEAQIQKQTEAFVSLIPAWAVPCLAVGSCVPLAAPPQNRPTCCPTSGPLQGPLRRAQLPARHIAHASPTFVTVNTVFTVAIFTNLLIVDNGGQNPPLWRCFPCCRFGGGCALSPVLGPME
jgi:hypothetical protein